MIRDWIKLHRKLRRSPIMKHPGLCHLWVHCLLSANWKPSKWLIPGTTKTIDVPRGSFVTGRYELHAELYPHGGRDRRKVRTTSASTLWRWLLSLERMGCIKLANVDNRCTLVSIVKYGDYQHEAGETRTAGEQPADNCRTTAGQPVSTSEEREEIQEGEEERSSASLPMYGQFEVFWRAYPRKSNRERALAEWDRLCPTVDVLDRMLKAIAWFKKNDPSWSDPSFTPYPSRFLSERRWEDEQISARPTDEPEEDIDTRWRRQQQQLRAACGEGA